MRKQSTVKPALRHVDEGLKSRSAGSEELLSGGDIYDMEQWVSYVCVCVCVCVCVRVCVCVLCVLIICIPAVSCLVVPPSDRNTTTPKHARNTDMYRYSVRKNDVAPSEMAAAMSLTGMGGRSA